MEPKSLHFCKFPMEFLPIVVLHQTLLTVCCDIFLQKERKKTGKGYASVTT